MPRVKRIEMVDVGDLVVYYPREQQQTLAYVARFRGCLWGCDPIPLDQGDVQVRQTD